MPNHYYGYNPNTNTVDSNKENFQDDVYRPPLSDMSTDPSSPLFQAMNNQRGNTFRQFEANQNNAENYINNLNSEETETPLGVALNNRSQTIGIADSTNRIGGKDEVRAGTAYTFNPEGEGGDDGGGDDGGDGGELKDPSGNGGGGDGSGSGNDGSGDDGSGDDGSGSNNNNNFLTPLEQALSEYDVGRLQDFYGNVFDEYDPTLESFQNREQSLTDRDLDLQRNQAQLNFDRQEGDLDRGLSRLGRQEDVLGRQISSLGRRESAIGRQIGALGRQEDLLQGQYDMATGLDQAAQDRLELQRTGLTDRQGDVGADYELQQAQLGLSQLGIEGAQEDLATNFALQQRRSALQRGNVEARQGDIDEDLTMQNRLIGLQREDQLRGVDMARSQARGNLLNLYEDSQNTGGFAGSGARDAIRNRAIDSFTENAQNRISSLSDTRRLDIASEQAQTQRDRQYRGTESQLSGLDITDEQMEARRATQERGLGLQLGNLSISQERAKNSKDRQLRSLGSQLSGVDITDTERQLKFDQQQGNTLSRIEDVRDSVLNAQGAAEDVRGNIANVRGNVLNLQDEMAGMEDQRSYLQSALQNTFSGINLSGLRSSLGTERNIFNLRSDYEDDVRGRLIDIISSGGDLNPFKLTDAEKAGRDVPTATDSMSAYNDFYANFYND